MVFPLSCSFFIPPFSVRAYYDLLDAGVKLDRCPLTIDELVDEVCR